MSSDINLKVKTFFNKYTVESFEKDTVIISFGTDPVGIFYLAQGTVKQNVVNTEGDEMTLNIFKSGSFFPMSFALDEYKNNCQFIAMENVSVHVAPINDVIDFLKNENEVLIDLLKRLYRGLDGMQTRLESLMKGTAKQKLLTTLVIAAKRFGSSHENKIRVSLKLTHQELAELSGLSRETISREMSELKKENLISYSNTTLEVHDLDLLEKKSSNDLAIK